MDVWSIGSRDKGGRDAFDFTLTGPESLLHAGLLELDADAGFIRFASHRAILLDVAAMGHLRVLLVDSLGETAARTLLTQFGFAHGWQLAESFMGAVDPPTVNDWFEGGLRIFALAGLFRPGTTSVASPGSRGISALGSFEAEQHLSRSGRSGKAVCWSLCGLLSGYMSRVSGQDVYVMEERCCAKGDAVCHFVGQTRDAWGEAAARDLLFYEKGRLSECLDVSLRTLVDALKQTERQLNLYQRSMSVPVVEPTPANGIVVRSAAMRAVVDLARRVALVDATVLITGESGTGKERIARLVHEQSERASGPFVAVNCGAIAETLLESELFGHARGAFTGASSDRAGLFEAAHSGTLFLDEIGEVSAGMQVKLLRVLQEREVRRVGENRTRKIDVRIITATNRNLSQGVVGGGFRQDLYYRLKVVELHVPPLRERKEDILELARVLLAHAAARMKRRVTSFSPTVADRLVRYPWPGNVRELENAMERAVALARSTRVDLDDIPEEVRDSSPMLAPTVPTEDAPRTLEEVEKDHILNTLRLNGGNQTRTAAQLQIGSATLYRKLKGYGLGAGSISVHNGTE